MHHKHLEDLYKIAYKALSDRWMNTVDGDLKKEHALAFECLNDQKAWKPIEVQLTSFGVEYLDLFAQANVSKSKAYIRKLKKEQSALKEKAISDITDKCSIDKLYAEILVEDFLLLIKKRYKNITPQQLDREPPGYIEWAAQILTTAANSALSALQESLGGILGRKL